MNDPQVVVIAEPDAVHRRVKELSKHSDEVKSRLAGILKKLWVPERPLGMVTQLQVFDDLRMRFPNFEEVIDIVEANAIGLAHLGLPFEMNPILLAGDPGLGKTLFLSELAGQIGLPFYEISMATATASFALSGGSIQWSEGSPGFIAKSLADSPYANPVFMVDEIDKASRDSRFNPLSPFYSLLENHSAKRFKDEALEIDINASKVIWFATANRLDLIPDPILSRMRVINIRRPDEKQMKQVVASIYQALRTQKAYGHLLDPETSTEIMEELCTRAPREAKLALDEACLKAISNQRYTLCLGDLPTIRKETFRVGFI